MQIWAESGKSALPICNYSQILYQFLTFTQNLKRSHPFFYPAAPTDNLDYQRLLVYLSECTNDQITTILALVEAYLRTYKTHETE